MLELLLLLLPLVHMLLSHLLPPVKTEELPEDVEAEEFEVVGPYKLSSGGPLESEREKQAGSLAWLAAAPSLALARV